MVSAAQTFDRPIILMVDQDPGEGEILSAAMISLQIPLTVETVTGGGCAMNRLCQGPSEAASPVALVLINDYLPDMRGSDLAKVLARDPAFGVPRVVLMAGGPYYLQLGSWEAWLEKPRSWSDWGDLAHQLQQRLLAVPEILAEARPGSSMDRAAGVEPTRPAWKAGA
jgi:CheY-like chemotaxis protein